MADVSELKALKERCEKAEGADREIDEQIAVMLCSWCLHKQKTYSGYQDDTGFTCDECGADSWGNTSKSGQRLHDAPLRYTASIDAALGLVKKLLPGWIVQNLSEWDHEAIRATGPWMCQMKPRGRPMLSAPPYETGCMHAAAPALAILSALLSALISRAEQQSDAEGERVDG